MTGFAAVKPCLTAFWEERALPLALVGPVEYLAWAALAAAFWGVVIEFSLQGEAWFSGQVAPRTER
jgi:hypothetical protein